LYNDIFKYKLLLETTIDAAIEIKDHLTFKLILKELDRSINSYQYQILVKNIYNCIIINANYCTLEYFLNFPKLFAVISWKLNSVLEVVVDIIKSTIKLKDSNTNHLYMIDNIIGKYLKNKTIELINTANINILKLSLAVSFSKFCKYNDINLNIFNEH